MELNICHLYPDILNLYGDRGNIITMKRRLEDRGIKVNIEECSIGQPLDISRYDIFFIGGGQDFEQEVLLRDLASGKGRGICSAVEDEKVFLAICGGYQMLGQYYKTWDGSQLDFIGAIDIHTIGAKERMIGNYMFRTAPESSGSVVVGFENHSGQDLSGRWGCAARHGAQGLWQQRRGPDRGRAVQKRVCDLLARLAAAQKPGAVRFHPADRACPQIRRRRTTRAARRHAGKQRARLHGAAPAEGLIYGRLLRHGRLQGLPARGQRSARL